MRDRTTDPRRVAQLLASELDGRDRGAFAGLAVVDADRDATPSPDGTRAYAVERDGVQVAAVLLFPDEVALDADDATAAAARERGLSVEGGRVLVPDGASVKAAAAALAETTS
jgi:hypothetical protein